MADTSEFVTAFSICAHGKSSHRVTVGLLRPLPNLSSPWSHSSVNFTTGLPPSEGKTVILTIVDCFSKAVHFVPLVKLPLSLETANLLILHVFRLHGIPQKIASDQGPQFTSQVWRVS